jgi:putative mycofactocin binding protein MftB
MAAPVLDPRCAYRLHPCVALRPEAFGALAYHFGNRRLTFLKDPELVEVVLDLDRCAGVGEALARIPATRRDAFRRALGALAAAEVIIARRDGTGVRR